MEKHSGPSELSAELLKALGKYGIDWLHDTMKDVWNTGNIPDGWRKSVMVLIYKEILTIIPGSQGAQSVVFL